MSNPEGFSTAVPEQPVDQAPLPEGMEASVVARSTELDAQAPTIVEQAARLLKVAARSSQADSFDRARSAGDSFTSALLMTAATIPTVGVVSAAGGSSMNQLFTFGGIVVVAVAQFVGSAVSANRSKSTVHIPEGYDLQCVRDSRSPADTPKGKVVVAIHPRQYKNGEPPELTKKHLAAALDVIAAATPDKGGCISSVLIPAQLALAVDLPYQNYRLYAEALADVSTRKLYEPKDTRGVVVVPASQARELAEYVRNDSSLPLGRVLNELATCFPGAREALAPSNQALIKVLHRLLERTVGGDMGVRVKEKGTRQLDAEGRDADGNRIVRTVTVPTGDIVVRADSTYTLLDCADPYNPRLIVRSAASSTEVSNSDLRTLTGGQTAKFNTLALNNQQYSKLQLIRIALELLQPHSEVEPDAPQVTAVLPQGEKPDTITSYGPDSPSMHSHGPRGVGRALGRSALASGLLVSGMFAAGVMGGDHDSSGPVPSSVSYTGGSAPILWRIEDAGEAQQTSAYWTQHTHYSWSAKRGWSTHKGELSPSVQVPWELSQDQPHLTVQGLLNTGSPSLPIEYGTGVGAIRAYGPGDVHLPVSLVRTDDGKVVARVDNNGTYYRLEYDLIASDDWHIDPVKPPKINGQTVDDPSDYPGTNGDVRALTSYTNQQFTYDDGDEIKKQLAKIKTPKEYVEYIYGLQRCQCGQCNTATAMLAAELFPDQNLAYMTGYLHPTDTLRAGQHQYLVDREYHAWLQNRSTVLDSTAGNIDENSHIKHPQSGLDADALWNKTLAQTHLKPNEPSKFPWNKMVWPLVGMVATAGAGAEMRYRLMRRTAGGVLRWGGWVTAANGLDPRDAVRLLGWEAYGKPGSAMPKPGSANYNGERADNIPTETLRAVKRGQARSSSGGGITPRQARGLARTAAAVLRERSYDERRRRKTRRR